MALKRNNPKLSPMPSNLSMTGIGVGWRGGRDETCEVTRCGTTSSADLGVSSKFFGEIPKAGSKERFQHNVNQCWVSRS